MSIVLFVPLCYLANLATIKYTYIHTHLQEQLALTTAHLPTMTIVDITLYPHSCH